MELQEITDIFTDCGFQVFKDCIAKGGSIKAVVVPDKADMTRKEIDKITELAKKNGAKGLVTLKYMHEEISGSIDKIPNGKRIECIKGNIGFKRKQI